MNITHKFNAMKKLPGDLTVTPTVDGQYCAYFIWNDGGRVLAVNTAGKTLELDKRAATRREALHALFDTISTQDVRLVAVGGPCSGQTWKWDERQELFAAGPRAAAETRVIIETCNVNAQASSPPQICKRGSRRCGPEPIRH